MKSNLLFYATITAVVTHFGSSRADFISPSIANGYAWDRPTTISSVATFQAWEAFSTTAGPNSPNTVHGIWTGNPATVSTGAANNFLGFGGPAGSTWVPINIGGTANAFDANHAMNGGFVTSGGNIYSPGGILAPRIVVPNNLDGMAGNNSLGMTTILLQIRTQGSDIDLSSVKLFDPLSGIDVAPVNSQLLAEQVLGGFGGTLRDRLFEFRVNGNADTYTINMHAASSSLSLDRVAVDTFYTPIPEPAGLIGIMAMATAFVALRFHHSVSFSPVH